MTKYMAKEAYFGSGKGSQSITVAWAWWQDHRAAPITFEFRRHRKTNAHVQLAFFLSLRLVPSL